MTWVLASGLALVFGALLALFLPNNAARAWAAIGSQALASGLALAAVVPVLATGHALSAEWGWSFPVEIVRVRVDPLSAFFLAWSLPLTLLGTVYAWGYLQPFFKAGRNGGVHFALLNMVSLSFLIVYTVENALVFTLGWEIAAVSAWLLVIWDYPNQKIRFAGFNYLVSTHIGLFFLVAAFMVMRSQTASMDFGDFSRFLHTPSRLRNVTFVLLVVTFGFKSAFFPFHTWLPRAHSAAPAHVSALMSGVIHKAGLFGMLRFTLLMGQPEEWMGWFLVGFSALSAFFGVLYTSTQRDLKRLLGYSSTENVGIAGIGFGVGILGLCWQTPALVLAGFAGGIFHLFNHALFKCLLFYAAGAIYRATHTIDLERLGGLAKKMPRTAFFFLLGGLAISALPPLNGFVSEFILYTGLLGDAPPSALARGLFISLAALLAFVGGVSALSMTRAFGITFLGQPRDARIKVESDAPWPLFTAMGLHAAAVVVVGLLPATGLWLVKQPAMLFGALLPAGAAGLGGIPAALAPVEWAVSLLVVAMALLLAVAFFAQRRAATHVTWGCGYTAGNTRMQYSGTSFSSQFAQVFETALPQLRRGKLPTAYFPQENGHLATHHVDAVERRMFEVLGDGEAMVQQVVSRVPEQPRYSFAAGLLMMVGMVGLLLWGLGQ
jgi:hydrogenase-4 component B